MICDNGGWFSYIIWAGMISWGSASMKWSRILAAQIAMILKNQREPANLNAQVCLLASYVVHTELVQQVSVSGVNASEGTPRNYNAENRDQFET